MPASGLLPQTFIMDMDSFRGYVGFLMKCELSHHIIAPPAQKMEVHFCYEVCIQAALRHHAEGKL